MRFRFIYIHLLHMEIEGNDLKKNGITIKLDNAIYYIKHCHISNIAHSNLTLSYLIYSLIHDSIAYAKAFTSNESDIFCIKKEKKIEMRMNYFQGI